MGIQVQLNTRGGNHSLKCRLLNRGELIKLSLPQNAYDRALWVLTQTVEELPSELDLDSLPFGVVLNAADKVIEASSPSIDEVAEKVRADIDQVWVKQELLITLAFPDVTIQSQQEMSVEEWVRTWMMAQWKLSLMGLGSEEIMELLYPEQVAVKRESSAAAELSRVAESNTPEARQAQQQYSDHVARAAERILRKRMGEGNEGTGNS